MEWISVKDKLPSTSEDVLIFVGGDIIQAYLLGGSWKGSKTVTDNMNDGYVNDNEICKQGGFWDFVTHWMPLPEPPKSNTNG